MVAANLSFTASAIAEDGNVLDEALAAIDLLRPVSIDIEAEHLELALHGRKRQRNADITEAHDSD